MVLPRYDGAAIPRVPGSGGSAPRSSAPSGALTGHPTTRRYATGYLQGLADTRRNDTLAYLQSSGKSGEAWVYAGSSTSTSPLTGHPGSGQSRSRTTTEHQQSVQQLMTYFEYFSTEKRKTLAKQLFMGGFLSKPDANLMDLQEAYANLLSSAAARYAQGQQVTPERLLEQNIRYNLAAAGVEVDGKFSDRNSKKWFQKLMGSGDGSDLGRAAGAAAAADPELDLSGKFTTTNRSVDLWSPEDARGLIRSVLRRELDRDPTELEFTEFVSTLQSAQRKHPTVTKTTQTLNKDGNVTNTSSVTHGGLNESGINELATEEAQSNPGWAEWQAVGTYFPALLDAMGSAVPGV